MTDEHQLGSGDDPTIGTFAQIESARASKAVNKIEARNWNVLNDLKITIDLLDALPRFIKLDSDREKFVVTCTVATRQNSDLRNQPFGDGGRFAANCDDLSTRIASFRRRFALSTDVDRSTVLSDRP